MRFSRRELRLGVMAALIGAAIAVILVLSGKPGEEDDSGIDKSFSGEQAAVAALIEEAGATRSADDCDRLATTRFLEQTFRLSAESALSACQNGLGERGLLDEPLRVAAVVLRDEADTAIVVYETGNDKAGLTAAITVVDGRLLGVGDYLEPDRGALERALRSELLGRPEPITKGQAECAVAGLRSLPDEELEALLLAGSITAIYEPVLACARESFVGFIVQDLSARLNFLPASVLGCWSRALVQLPTAEFIKTLVDSEHTAAARIPFECDKASALRAYRQSLTRPPQTYPQRLADCVAGGLGALQPRAIAATLIERGTDKLIERCKARR